MKRNLPSLTNLLAVMAMSLLLTNCLIQVDWKTPVTFTSPQPNAKVTIGTRNYAMPASVRLPKGKGTANVTLSAPNYPSKELLWCGGEPRSYTSKIFFPTSMHHGTLRDVEYNVIESKWKVWECLPDHAVIGYNFATDKVNVREQK